MSAPSFPGRIIQLGDRDQSEEVVRTDQAGHASSRNGGS
jgi:hypothetical protein